MSLLLGISSELTIAYVLEDRLQLYAEPRVCFDFTTLLITLSRDVLRSTSGIDTRKGRHFFGVVQLLSASKQRTRLREATDLCAYHLQNIGTGCLSSCHQCVNLLAGQAHHYVQLQAGIVPSRELPHRCSILYKSKHVCRTSESEKACHNHGPQSEGVGSGNLKSILRASCHTAIFPSSQELL